MAQVVFDFPPSVFSAVRKAPAEFAEEMRLAAAIHWYTQGTVSQGKAAEIAGLSRAELLEELVHRKIPAIQVTLDELRPNPVLAPLPVLEGFVPAGWKDAIYDEPR